MELVKVSVILVLISSQSFVQIWATPINLNSYELKRREILKSEEDMAFGGTILLEGNEKLANDCLMTAKFREIDEGK